MKKSVAKRVLSLVLALAVVLGGVVIDATPVKAEEETIFVSQIVTAVAGVESGQTTFTLDAPETIVIGVWVLAPTSFTIRLYKEGSLYDRVDISTYDSYWHYEASLGVFDNGDVWNLSAGDYGVSVTFSEDIEYILFAQREVAVAKISQESATITKGFSKKLSVSGGNVKSWSSGNKKIATVDKKGKVTGKKAGKVTITALLTDGSKLKCKVTVKDNKYTDSKITLSDVPYGQRVMGAYSITYDKSGNLVIKTTLVNNTSYKVVKLQNVKIVVKDGDGKVIGTYKGNQSATIPAYSTKDLTFTIKKASLKKKHADLRLISDVDCKGTCVYVYY